MGKEIKSGISVADKKITPSEALKITNELLKDTLKADGVSSVKDYKLDGMDGKTKLMNIYNNLGQKMIYQMLKQFSALAYADTILNFFNDEVISVGAGKQFAAPRFNNLARLDDKFVPDNETIIDLNFANFTINYDLAGAKAGTSPNSFAWRVQMVWKEYEVKQVVISEVKLAEFLNTIKTAGNKLLKPKLYDKIMRLIPTIPYTKVITGVAGDMFDAMVEFKQEALRATYLTNEYNITAPPAGQTPFFTEMNLDESILLINYKIINKATSGIASQLYRAPLWQEAYESFKNIHIAGPATIWKDENNSEPKMDTSDYIPETDIYLIHKEAIRVNPIYEYAGIDLWSTNANGTNTQIYMFAINPIWFNSAFKYTNPNLPKLPTN